MALNYGINDTIRTVQNKTPVPMLDLKAQYLPLKEEINAALKDIIENGQFVLGHNVSSLEKEISSYHEVSYGVGLASGTDALHLCLHALGIKDGDEVITSPFSFMASAEAITYVGGTPVFVDIHRDTLNIDVSRIEERISSRTKAIIVVHLFGQPADMKEIMEIARKYNLWVIEDCAQAFGASYQGKVVGGIGDAGCYSFYPSKNLGAYGDGGMMVTDLEDIYQKVRLLRNHGTVSPYEHQFIGYNSRLDEIQAAVLRIKLKRIEDYNQKRRNIAEVYTSLLSGSVKCPVETEDSTHVYHQYTIRSPWRSEIAKTLEKNRISSVIYYPVPLHMQEAFAYLGYKKNNFPESEAAAQEVLSIPIFPELHIQQAEFIADTIARIVRNLT